MASEKVCSVSDLTLNQAKKVVVGGVAIALVLDAAGEVHAIGDTCTHGDISLSEGFVEDNTLECWAHGSKFELSTGMPLTLRAFVPVHVLVVDVVDGDILIDPDVKKAL